MIQFLLAQDEPEWIRGAWANQTVMHPTGLALLIILGLALLALPRRYAVLPIFLMMCVAGRQRISIITLDWDFLRIMVVIGWTRVWIRKESRLFRWHRLDTISIWWAIFATLGYIIQQASGSAVVFKLGMAVDTLGSYFLFRTLIRTWDDVIALFRGTALIAIPVAGAFLVERATGRNPFSFFGGVPEITKIREGRLRCQGAFTHPILAGSFWAAVMPYYIALLFGKIDKVLGAAGLVAGIIIVFTCASSTPLAAVGAVFLGWGFFVLRHHLTSIRWGFVGLLVALQMVMNKPVYHLISRIDLVGGSTGWHRYFLIHQFLLHTTEWFLVGTRSTAHWGRGMFDVTNQYVLEAVRGGILALVFFIWMLVSSYRAVGTSWRAVETDRFRLAIAWSTGVAIFTHCVIFIAVSYFGQIVVMWHLALALTASVAIAATAPTTARTRVPRAAVSSVRRSTTARPIGAPAPRPVRAVRPRERTA